MGRKKRPKQSEPEKKSAFPVFAWALVVLAASGTAWGFSRAVSDSLQWNERMDRAIVNPTFLEKDVRHCKRVPDFELTDRNKHKVKLSDFASVDTLLINIWSSGCPVCEEELPSIAEMDRRIGNTASIALLTITTDENWADVSHLFPRGTNLRIFFDPRQKITRDIFGTTLYPETFVLDRNRCIRARFDGEREWHSSELIQYVASFK